MNKLFETLNYMAFGAILATAFWLFYFQNSICIAGKCLAVH